MSDLFGVPVWALLVVAAAAGGWLLLLAVVTTATRPRPVPAGPATLDLGDEPPALVNLLTGGWKMTEDALSATLLDLAARDLVDLVQSGPEPEQTVVRIREPAPPELTAYERRVYDRVAALAAGGVVPVAALARGSRTDATRWWRAFRREVIVDAQRRGLSRNRWGRGIKTVFSVASLVPGLAVALAVGVSADDGDGVWAAGFGTWLVLAGYAASRNRQRDTPAGREVAARWLGVRDHLGRNEVFDTLPPAAVAIWDRYLGYGAATGVAGTASRVLAFGAQSERLAWSAYGGSWHRVRIRYPGARVAEGRHPVVAALVGAAVAVAGWYAVRGVRGLRRSLDSETGLGLTPEVDQRLDNDWTRLVLLVLLLLLLAAIAWGAWTIARAVLDLAGRRTFEAEVLRVRERRNDDKVLDYQVALDDGKSERVRAWPVAPKRMIALLERDVVSVTVGPRLRHVSAISVVRRAPVVDLGTGSVVDDSQVIEDSPAPARSGWSSVLSGAPATGPDPVALLPAEDVGAALGRPVTVRAAAGEFGGLALIGMRMVEYAAVDGPERVLVQVGSGGLVARAAGLGAGRGGEPVAGGAGVLRDGSAVVRAGDTVVAVHLRHGSATTGPATVRRLAELAAQRLGAGPGDGRQSGGRPLGGAVPRQPTPG